MATRAELVKQLRELTQAGMSDCMKALAECNDDLEAAQKWLREKGMAKANKKAGAVAYEGIVRAGTKGDKALIMEVNSQTDFTAKNENFINLTNDIFNSIIDQANSDSDIESTKVNGTPLLEAGMQLTATTGEKIAYRRANILVKNSNQMFATYTHTNNRIAVLLLIEGKMDEEAAKDIAMHAAAMAPKYLDKDSVEQSWLQSEKEILQKQYEEEMAQLPDGKAKEEKLKRADVIIQGKVSKLLKEICLVDQLFVKDNSITVGDFAKKNGGTIIKMFRYELGEGIEKKESNFADEVAAQMAGK